MGHDHGDIMGIREFCYSGNWIEKAAEFNASDCKSVVATSGAVM